MRLIIRIKTGAILAAVALVGNLCATVHAQGTPTGAGPTAALDGGAYNLADEPVPEGYHDTIYRRGKADMLDYVNIKKDARQWGTPFCVALQKARDGVRLGNLTEAETAYAQAAALNTGMMPYDEWGDTLEALGRTDEAIATYRQGLYGASYPDGKPLYDWTDEDGQSVHAKVKANGSGASGHSSVWMGYALLLAKHRRYAEALYAYERGRERTVCDDDLADYFDLKMTPETFRRATFEAAARTLLGATMYSYRSLYDYVCPENVRIAQYEKALALKPNFTPALLFMGFAYSRHYKPEIKNQAVPTIERAMYYGSPSVRKRGQGYLDMLEKERRVYEAVKPASPGG